MRKKISNFRFEKFAFFVFFVALALISAKSASAQKIMSNGSDYLQIVATSTLTSSTLNFIPSTSANSFSLQAIANPVVPASTISIFEYLSSTSLFKMLNGVFNFNPTTGNIGIGTTNPLKKLQVAQDLAYGQSQSGQLYLSGADGAKRLMLGYDTTNNFGFIEGINFGVAYSPIILNPYAGNVGIGMTTPAYKLDVAGDLNLNTYQIHKIGAPATGTDAVNRNYVDTLIGDSVNAAQYWKLSGSNLYSSSTSWNVGIGTTTPGYPLQVNSTGAAYNSIPFSAQNPFAGTSGGSYAQTMNLVAPNIVPGNGNLFFFGKNATTNNSGIMYFNYVGNNSTSNSLSWGFYNNDFGMTLGANNGLAVGWNGAVQAAPANGLTVKGNVGIGTSNPSYNLDVAGSARLTNGLINSNDYFEKVFSNGVAFPNGTADQAVDIRLGNTSLWGYIEVEIDSTYNNQNSTGKLTKIFAVGVTANNNIYTNESRVSDAMGTVPDNVAIGDLSWDSTNSTYRIPLSHIVSTGNNYTVKVRMFTSAGGAKTVFDNISLSNVYTLSALKRPYVYYNSRVGIGTSNPSYLFDVAGEGDFSGNQVHGIAAPTNGTDAANKNYVDSILVPTTTPGTQSGFWTTGANNNIYSNNTGNVGIGTTAPIEKLHVVGNNYTTGYQQTIGATYTGAGLWLGSNQTVGIYKSTSDIRFKSTSDLMSITASGNVGINTMNPLTRLYINGTASDPASSGSIPNGIASFVADAKYGLYFGALKSSSGLWLQASIPNDLSAKFPIILNPRGGNVGVGIVPSSSYTLDVNGDGNFNGSQIHNVASPTTSTDVANRAYVDSVAQTFASTSSSTISYWNATGTNIYNNNSGNIGVGTSNPGDKFTVSGGNLRLTTATGQGIKAYDAATGGNYIFSLTRQSSVNANDLNIGALNGFAISTGASGVPTTGYDFYIDSTGNTGIGTEYPTTKLDIKGISSSTMILLESSDAGGFTKTNFGTDQDYKFFIDALWRPNGLPSFGAAALKLNPSGGAIVAGGTIYNSDSSYWLRFDSTLTDSLKVQGNLNTTAGSIKVNGTGNSWVMGKLGIGTTDPFATAGMTIETSATSSAILFRTGTDRTVLSFKNGIFLGSKNLGTYGGSSSIGIGQYTLDTGSGGSNVAIGNSALQLVGAGAYNVAIGELAMQAGSGSSGIGSSNVAIGNNALRSYSAGDYNIAIGYNALSSGGNSVGSRNIAIGNGGSWANGSSNKLYIGELNTSTHLPFIYGNMTSSGFGMAIGTTTLVTYGSTNQYTAALTVEGAAYVNGPFYSDGALSQTSDRRAKHNIKSLGNEDYQKVLKLRPVSFTFNKNNLDSYGFIAQEVKELYPEAVTNNVNGMMSLSYETLLAPTVAAVQAQEKKIEEQDTLIRILLDRVNKLEHSAK